MARYLIHRMTMYLLGGDRDILVEGQAWVLKTALRVSGYKLSAMIKAITQTDAFPNRVQREAEAMASAA